MHSVDEARTYGRTRLSFADEADIDEFVTTLDRYERGELTRTNGAPSASSAAPTANARRATPRCCG